MLNCRWTHYSAARQRVQGLENWLIACKARGIPVDLHPVVKMVVCPAKDDPQQMYYELASSATTGKLHNHDAGVTANGWYCLFVCSANLANYCRRVLQAVKPPAQCR